MVEIGTRWERKTWIEHSGLKPGHTPPLKIRPGQDSIPKIMKFLGWMGQDIKSNQFLNRANQ